MKKAIRNFMPFMEHIKRAAERLKTFSGEEVVLLHHNDADGLTAGFLLQQALERQGFHVHRVALEKPYPEVVSSLYETYDGPFIFADFGSFMAPLLLELNKKKNLTIILDHHRPRQAPVDWFENVNPRFFGIEGDRDLSASGVCYLFAKEMDEGIKGYAHLPILGALGDHHPQDGVLVGVHEMILDEAKEAGVLEVERKDGKEIYHLSRSNMDAHTVQDILTTLGAVGYYSDGVKSAFQWMASDFMEERFYKEGLMLHKKRDRAFRVLEENLKSGELHMMEMLQWFDTSWYFHELGVKAVGLFCQKLKERPIISPHRFIVGMQPLPPYIPQVGTFPFVGYKVSVRSPQQIEERIWRKELPPVHDFLSTATERVSGFVDACHTLSGATVIPMEKQSTFLLEMDRLICEGTSAEKGEL